MKEEIVDKIRDLKKEKIKALEQVDYERMISLRDNEKELHLQLREYPEYKELYNEYLQEKVKEFEKLTTLEGKDYRGVESFFEYALKNTGSDFHEYSKKNFLEIDMNCYDLVQLRKYPDQDFKKIKKEDTEFLNKWILKNLISYNDWFKNFVRDTIK